MDHNKKRRRQERWIATLAALTFVLGFGILVGHTGFRIDAGPLGNLYGLTPSQWGVLVSGLVGSIAGGIVAVWVLRRTLDHQDENHRRQLDQTQKLHVIQLEAQKAEATRQRAHAMAAVLLSGFWGLARNPKASADEMVQHIDAIIQAAHNLRLESEHSDLAQALMSLNGELYDAPSVIPGNETARKELLRITGAVSGAVVLWFQAEDLATRQATLRSIKKSKDDAKNLLQPDQRT